jgi:hypothetical protein
MNTKGKNALTRAAAITAATGATALALASPASAKTYSQAIAVNCPQPFSQSCPATGKFAVPADGPLFVSFSGDPGACADINEHIYVNGVAFGPAQVGPGTTDQGYHVNKSDVPGWPDGKYHIEVRADGVLGGCNTGSMSGWSGTLHVEVGDDAQGPAPAGKTTATVTGDVDVYNIAAGDTPDENGVKGVKIGMLRSGQQVELAGTCQPNDWCKILAPGLPGGNGFIWGHLQF